MARRRPSLHLGSTPVPPSLLESPYLTSPIFGQEVSASHLPTEQDELWLQDTIPLSATSSGSSGSLAIPSRDNSRNHPHQQNANRPAPHSPPIIINHHHPPRSTIRSRDRSYTQPPPYNFLHPRDLHSPIHSYPPSLPQTPLSDDCPSTIITSHTRSKSQVHLPYPCPYAIPTRPCTWAESYTRKHSDSDITRLVRDTVAVQPGRYPQREKIPGDRGASPNGPVAPLR